MIDKSTVCVLLPFFGSIGDLKITLNSLHNSKFKNFHLYVIDDNHKPKLTNEFFDKYDFNTYLILNKKNLGIVKSLNKALKVILNNPCYKYVVRIDSGDAVTEDRITLQLDFMNKNSDYGAVGSFLEYTSKDGKFINTKKFPINFKGIKKHMYFNSSIAHPACIIRTSVFKDIGLYNNYKHAEDFELFTRMIKKYKIYNIPMPLTKYMITTNQISHKYFMRQKLSLLFVKIKYFDFSFMSFLGFIYSILIIFVPKFLVRFLNKYLLK